MLDKKLSGAQRRVLKKVAAMRNASEIAAYIGRRTSLALRQEELAAGDDAVRRIFDPADQLRRTMRNVCGAVQDPRLRALAASAVAVARAHAAGKVAVVYQLARRNR